MTLPEEKQAFPEPGVLETEEQLAASDQPVCPAHTTHARLMAKIDWHVIPYLCIMYLLAFLDRVNIGNAKLFGLIEDLNLGTGDKFNTALVVFFVPYILFEIPSNIILKRFRPHVWLAGNMFLFGFITMMQGLVHNYGGLIVVRFLLGIFEAGMFPGAFYLIGMWYTRDEAQKRFSFFFNSTSLAGAFGGLLAAAIGKMDHMHGFRGWRWIFIIEGGLTVFVSVFLFFLLPDFPESVKWLDESERAYVAARLRADQATGSGHHKDITPRDVLATLRDPKIIAAGFMYLGLICPAYGYAYFSPTILLNFHYGLIETQLRSVPPWVFGLGLSLIMAYGSDRARHRYLFVIGSLLIPMAGFIILLCVHDNRDAQYAAMFLVAGGSFTAMPIVICWLNLNLGGHTRRSIGSAWQVAFGNIAGIVAVYVFLAKDAPRFTVGYSVGLAFVIISMLSATVYWCLCWRANKARNALATVQLDEQEKQDLGDLAPTYRYLL